MQALQESLDAVVVTMSHFGEALRSVRPRLTKEDVRVYDEYLRRSRIS
jgi:SpoVK/Ycf46/Vps4 family AAA+-type ATPase